MQPEKSPDFIKATNEAYENKPDWGLVFGSLEKAAQKGDPNAYWALGTWYLFGKEEVGIKPNHEQALEYLKRAVAEGQKDSFLLLGIAYELGKGVPQSDKKAFELYSAGALQGDPECYYEIGRMYYWGHYVKKNRVLAELWLQFAEALGAKMENRYMKKPRSEEA